MKGYKYKLRKPSKRLIAIFEAWLDGCRELYNAGLQERRDAYRLTGKSPNFHQQCAQLPSIKIERPDIAEINAQVLQATLRRLSRSFDNFFRRVKAKETPGYPRFKGKRFFNSFTFPQMKGAFRLDGDKLILSRIGSCRIRLSRPIEGEIKTCTIKRQADGWFVIFVVEESYLPFIPKTGASVGIDLGIENFVTLSTGEVIDNPRFLRASMQKLKIAQRRISKRKLRGTNRRKAVGILARKHQRIANQRLDFFHKLSNQLIREFDDIAVEDLDIKGLLKNHHLAKSIGDAAWSTFITVLSSKAANAGRRVWKVAAAFTSQDCSRCGNRVRKSLAVREHRCIACGLVLHRDHNAAINILGRAGPLVSVGVS
jgi:putative transposase